MSETNLSEISFFEIINSALTYKFTIIALSVVIFFISFIPNFIFNKNYNYKIPVYKLSNAETSEFKTFDNILNSVSSKNKISVSLIPKLTQDYLLNEFISVFKEKSVLSKAIQELLNNDQKLRTYFKINTDSSNEEISQIAKKLSNIFKIEYKFEDNRGFKDILIEYNESEKGILNDLVNKIINNININVLNDIEKQVNEAAKNINLNNQLQIEKLKSQAELIKGTLLLQHQKNIIALKEQSIIAKSIGISESVENIETIKQEINPNNSDQQSYSIEINTTPRFTMGYKALDAEIQIFESRDLDRLELYDDELHETIVAISQLENNTSATNLLIALNSIPKKEDFRAVRVDLNFANVVSNNFVFSYKLPLLAFICSIIILTIFFAFYRAYISYSNNSREK